MLSDMRLMAKQLRLYGVDAAAVQTKGKGARHLVYRSAAFLLLCNHITSCLLSQSVMSCRGKSDDLTGRLYGLDAF